MKNKTAVYFLLVATLLIWVFIFIKIYNSVYDKNEPVLSALNSYKNEQEILSVDTFSIHPDYRDPFLGKIVSAPQPDRNGSVQIKRQDKIVIPAAASTQWPVIQYDGMIKNQKLNKQLALIRIDGIAATMKIGDETDKIRLCKIFRDSVELCFNKEKRIFRK